MYLKRGIAFYVFQDFSCCEDGNDHLELFTYQNRNHPFTSVIQKRMFSFDTHHKLYNISVRKNKNMHIEQHVNEYKRCTTEN